MNKILLFFMLSFATMLVFVPNSVFQTVILNDPGKYLATQFGIADQIGGFDVLAVLNSTNTGCLPEGTNRMVLRAQDGSIDGLLKNAETLRVQRDLQELTNAQDVYWEAVFIGPDTKLSEFLSENENLNAPATIANRPKAVMFQNNVRTDHSSFYLLQSGLQFWNGVGSTMWTDTTKLYVNQPANVPYVASHVYWSSISFTNGAWWMCIQDNSNPGGYTCAQETQGTGTTLKLDLNTAVWVENHNSTAGWQTGFSTPFLAFGAEIYRNGVGQDWASQHRHTMDDCSSSWPTANALKKSLVGGRTGQFVLPGVPLDC